MKIINMVKIYCENREITWLDDFNLYSESQVINNLKDNDILILPSKFNIILDMFKNGIVPYFDNYTVDDIIFALKHEEQFKHLLEAELINDTLVLNTIKDYIKYIDLLLELYYYLNISYSKISTLEEQIYQLYNQGFLHHINPNIISQIHSKFSSQ